MSFLRKMQIEANRQKEANNQEDEISEQSLQSQRTEENGEYIEDFRVYRIKKFLCQTKTRNFLLKTYFKTIN